MERGQRSTFTALALIAFTVILPIIVWSQASTPPPPLPPAAEYHFLRMQYVDLYTSRRGFGRGWWRQDWPEADVHFTQSIRRLTRIDIGEERHLPFTDDRVFEYPWIYATQVAYWDLTENEIRRMRDYLFRGGFLVVDDFHGPDDWNVF